MNNKKIFKIIKFAQYKINFLLLLEKLFFNFTIIGIISGIVFSFIQFLFRFSFINFYLWVVFNFFISLIFLIRYFFDLPDKMETANILDEKFRTNGIFSAALYCIEKGFNRTIHRIIIEDAIKSLDFKLNNILNYKVIIKKILFALLIASFVLMLFVLEQQRYFIFPNNSNFFKNEIKNGALIKSPNTISKILAKDDIALKKDIEKAIKNNDFNKLKKLIEKSNSNFNNKLSKVNEIEKKEFNEEALIRDEVINFLLKEYNKIISNSEGNKQNNFNRTNSNSAFSDKNHIVEKDNENQGQNLKRNIINTLLQSFYNKNIGKGEKNKNSNMLGKGLGDDNNYQEEEDISANLSKGEGLGKMSNQKIMDRNLQKELFLDEKKDQELFEYILKDKDPTLIENKFFLKEDVSTSITFDKKIIPVDYKDFIKNYFLTLSKFKNKTEENKDEKK